jgi:hypothetical protein
LLLAASEDQDGEPKPAFLEELRQRRLRIAKGEPVVAIAALRVAATK